MVLEIVAYTLVIAGIASCLIAAIGVLRFPDVFSRMHAAGISDTLGVLLVLFGLMFLSGLTLATVKLVIILAFLWMTSPTATHALAKAALHGGVRPFLIDDTPREEESSKH